MNALAQPRHGIPVHTLLKVGIAVVALGCGSDGLTLPSEGEPSVITIMAGNDQNGTVGTELGESLVVHLADGEGRPVANRPVAFNITAGSVLPLVVQTDDHGDATFAWQLGTMAGPQHLDVGISAAGNLTPKATFSATAGPGPVTSIQVVSGNAQAAQASTAVPESLVVRLVDTYGNPVPGRDVLWQAQDGNVSAAASTTDPDGLAGIAWILGPTLGTQTVNAIFAPAADSPRVFTATATQGPPPHLALLTQPSSTVQSGVTFDQQPAIQIEDALGNPLAQPGVQVTAAVATGGGTLGGTTTVTTDNAGIAQFTDLYLTGTAGGRTIIFAAVGHTSAISQTVTVTPTTVDPTLSTVEVAPSVIQAGNEVAIITVTARDDAGNPIAGLPVVVAVSGSGNTVTQPAGLTDANGVATARLSSTKAETKSIAANINTISVGQTASISVVAGPPSASTTTAQVPNGKRLRSTTITITTRDQFDNRLTTGGYSSQIRVDITGSNGGNPNVVDVGDGTYTASYFPLFKGRDAISITLNGTPIKGSPYTSNVN
jgi:adhesin/invasin